MDHRKRYSLISMLKANHGRIVNMFKMRSNLGGTYQAGGDSPLSYRINLILAPALWAAILLKLVGLSSASLPFAGAAAFIVVNLLFLRFTIENRGVLFTLRCLLLMTLEHSAAAVSLGLAVLERPFNKEYR